MKPASEIRFGIEVECYLPCGTRSAATHVGAGLQINWAPRGWGGKRDGSLVSYYAGYTPVEVVSPILAGEDGLTQVYAVISLIHEMHGIVDDTCGLHVHVDATGMSREQVEAVRASFVTYEKAFFGLNGAKAKARWYGHYCVNSNLWAGDGYQTRYQSLNLTNVGNPSKNTIEFRLWSGTLDVAIVVAAVSMAVALVARVMDGKGESGAQIQSCEDATKAFYGSHLYRHTAYRIVPDVTISDVISFMLAAAHEADQAFRE